MVIASLVYNVIMVISEIIPTWHLLSYSGALENILTPRVVFNSRPNMIKKRLIHSGNKNQSAVLSKKLKMIKMIKSKIHWQRWSVFMHFNKQTVRKCELHDLQTQFSVGLSSASLLCSFAAFQVPAWIESASHSCSKH